MERKADSTFTHSDAGGLIRLQARLTDPLAWAGPAWATLCGVVSSGNFGWQGEDWLRLALLILLVDGGWGTLWAALKSTDWATPLRRWRSWRSGEAVTPPPYTLPNSPGDRAYRWLGQLRSWWRNVLWPACGPALSALAVALPVMVILAISLGPELMLLSAAALAVMQLSLAWEGCSFALAILFPWLAGRVAFGPLTPASAGLALAFALAWGGGRRSESPWGRWLGVGGQLAASALLVVLRHPLATGYLLLMLIPQLALLPWLQRGQTTSWYVRYTQPWLMAAMLVAAWAL